MPDPGSSPGQALICNLEVLDITGIRLHDQVEDKLRRNDEKGHFLTFYEFVNLSAYQKDFGMI